MTVGPTLPKMTMEEQQRKQPKTPTEYPTPDGKRHNPRDHTAARNNYLAGNNKRVYVRQPKRPLPAFAGYGRKGAFHHKGPH